MRAIFTPRWIAAHIAVVVVAIVFVNLGLWQLGRNEERKLDNEIGAARFAADALPLADLLDGAGDDIGSLEFRRVIVTGEFDPANEVLIRSQVYRDNAGFHVVTPMLLMDGGAVLVNRGWVPLVLDTIPVAEAAPPSGETTVLGWIRLTRTQGALGPADPPEGRLVAMNRVDIERIQQQVPYDIASVYVSLLGDGGDDLPIPPSAPEFTDNGPHLGYAIQWFSFALIGVVGYGFLIRRSMAKGHVR